MGMAMGVNVDKKPMLPVVNAALKGLFNEPTDVFWTGRVLDLLFDGIAIDCSSSDFNVVAICTSFDSGEHKALRRVNETHFAFSLFGGVNGTDLGQFKVYRGKKNNHDIGHPVSFNDEEGWILITLRSMRAIIR